MWAKLMEFVLLPLVEKSVGALWSLIKGWLAERKELKKREQTASDNAAKVEEYEESDSIDSAADTFNKLP